MNILFALAHPDDEAFGPAGTIAKLSKDYNVSVLSLCRGDHLGNEETSQKRKQAFFESCKLLGANPIIMNSDDVHLDYHVAVKDIEQTIKDTGASVIFTHNISDIHVDHRVTAEACMVACRPRLHSTVDELYMCELPASTDWTFGQIEPAFVPNVYKDITEFINLKKQVMSLYQTEVHLPPDARSIQSMEYLAGYRGMQVGYRYAESFKLVFSRN